MSWGLRSLGPWLDLLRRRWLQLSGASALWLLGGSPGTPFSSLGGVAVVPAMVLLGFLCSGGPLDVYGSDLIRICPEYRGAALKRTQTWPKILFYSKTTTQLCGKSYKEMVKDNEGSESAGVA
ncbi:hypothetical protein ATANTOWER_024191 [Ataeniobius toweri]|uniref:Uncharacterized protein n=1 Tax=Ataeniobius toweri TaxID=208326 RepID=A0ABU7B458_9TELE|nr:hypothetical protein [Ataeniobius toweri]